MIVDTREDLDALFGYIQNRKTLLVPILADAQLHAVRNRVTCIYVYTEDDVERIVPINHTEQITGFSDDLQRFLDLRRHRGRWRSAGLPHQSRCSGG